MRWSSAAQLVALLLDLVTLRSRRDVEQGLEIILLRRQLRLLRCRQRARPRLSRWENPTPATLAAELKRRAAVACIRWCRGMVAPAGYLIRRRLLAVSTDEREVSETDGATSQHRRGASRSGRAGSRTSRWGTRSALGCVSST